VTFYYGYVAAAPAGVATTLAGTGAPGFADGTFSAAIFNYPVGVATMTAGSISLIVVADNNNQRIRIADLSTNLVTSIAGSASNGFADGTGTAASFNGPAGVATLPGYITVVADQYNSRIRLVTLGGVVTTLAGSGTPAFADGTGAGASFNYPYGVAVDASGTMIIVADTFNHCIRLITYPGGVVTTLAGNGTPGYADGIGTAASFNAPTGVAVLSNGNIVVADYNNYRIRIVTPTGIVATLAGSGTPGYADGTGIGASFNGPFGITLHPSGNILVSEDTSSYIRLVTPGGVVTTLAGNGTPGYADGTGTGASFNTPYGLAVLQNGSVVVGDSANNRIRLIT